MQNEKLLSLLGLARRAGKVQLGHDPVLESMRRGKSRLVLLAKDFSPNSARGILQEAEELGVKIFTLDCTLKELSAALGKTTGAVSVEDNGFAKKLKSYCSDT